MAAKITKLKDITNAAFQFTPEQVLEQTLDEYKAEELKGRKLLILSLDDTEGYRVVVKTAGMDYFEAHQLIEFVKVMR